MGPIDYSRPLRLLGLLGLIFSQSVWATDNPNVKVSYRFFKVFVADPHPTPGYPPLQLWDS